MKVATLQFSPSLGAVSQNISTANALLAQLQPNTIDLLVLPELAFSGYNFPSLVAITPFLEPTAAGPTTEWAVHTAKRLGCFVVVGYPEISVSGSVSQNFNSTVTVSPTGEVIGRYRKSFLYYTDETWASEGPEGQASERPFFIGEWGALGKVGHGICMDINPYKFTAPWTEFEFAAAMVANGVRVVVLSMAWLTIRTEEEMIADPATPDMETVAYWLERFRPLLREEEEVVVVFSNRCGSEGEEGARVSYAGSSCVMRFQAGSVKMFDRGEGPAILGKREEGVLVVDTAVSAKYELKSVNVST